MGGSSVAVGPARGRRGVLIDQFAAVIFDGVLRPDQGQANLGGVQRKGLARGGDEIGGDGKPAIPVTVSVGVSSLHRGVDTPENLMKRADVALYEAKSGGRNRVVAKAA